MMKKMKTFCKASLIFMALILFLIASTASIVTAEKVSPVITETQITSNVSDQMLPDIYGDKIVWHDTRNGNLDIYMYDLSTSKETQITSNESWQGWPDIYEDRIVWEDERNGVSNPDIYMYNLSTSEETQITTNESFQFNPAIYGDKIIWQDFRENRDGDAETDIYVYDLSAHNETSIATTALGCWGNPHPMICGDKVVWYDCLDESRRGIYIYDLSSNKKTLISADGSKPAIYGDKIVYVKDSVNLYLYNISTSTETKISTIGSYKKSISIYGNRIVWEDYRSDHPDIYMYDISNSTETRITTSESVDDPVAGTYNPVIYSDRIVWQDYRNGNNDIYMATLTWDEEPSQDDNNSNDSNTSDNEIQITTSGSADGPSTYGDKIVYASTRNGNTDVYMYDRTTKKETQITSSPDAQTHPVIYENRIVWQDDGGKDDGYTNHGIFMYDISTNKKMRISPTGLAYDPAIYGNRIVYSSTRNGNTDVYMYDLSTKKETQITSSPDAQTHPVIYENRIVWQDDGGKDDGYTNHGIFMYDIFTNKKMRISPTELAYEPAIYGNRIVYSNTRNGNTDVYMYDLSTKKETQITNSPDAQRSPAIYGNRIVWQDDGGEDDGFTNHGIFMYDISTNKKMRISSSGLAYQPVIYDNRIVWLYDDGYNSNIYMREI
mgnify:FL=1